MRERDRDRETVGGGGREREGERISNRLHVVSSKPNVGLDLTEQKSRARHLRD